MRVIAGHFNEAQGPASTFSPINVLDISLKQNQEAHLEVESGHNSIVFVRRGSVTLSSSKTELGNTQVAIMSQDGSTISLKATSEGGASILLLSGEPFDEPIAARGPFVMNTQQELMQAIIDYQSGNFGR